MSEYKKVVISQSMYFPWIGLLEQLRISDVFIHYDDVQYARGFFNRVQIKTANGSKWLTVPLRELHRGQKINEVLIDYKTDWRSSHRESLKDAYRNAPYLNEILSLVDRVFSKNHVTLAEISKDSILMLSDYFNLGESVEFINSDEMGISGSSSQRLNDLCIAVKADIYVTGHGAKNYLDHLLFEKSQIKVEYMNYKMTPYPQLHGQFNPFVTALDLIANCGKDGVNLIKSESIYWKDFLRLPE